MSTAAAAIWRAVSDAFGRLHGERARSRWLDAAQPAALRRGLFTLDVASADAKTAIDDRYRADLETLFREVTGSPVRLRTRLSSPAPPSRPAGPVPGSATAPRPAEFVLTPANRLAHAAVERFVRGGSGAFNPLFVHGPPGSGKTELGALALRCLRGFDAVRAPLALSAPALTRDVVRAARSGSLPALQDRWRACDLVILDEAHRLAGQRRSQAEAAHLLDPVLARGGRVLVLSRHAAHRIHGLDERLRSLFSGGMAVALSEPGSEDRVVVLDALAGVLAALLQPGVTRLLAERCPGTLGSAARLLRLLAERAAEDGGSVTLEAAGAQLEGRPGRAHGLDDLVGAVSAATGVTVERIRSAEKSRDAAAARHLCIHVATRSLGWSARQVCRYLGLRSPSVVAYARRQVERRRGLDPGYDRLVHELQARVEGAQRDLAW